MKPIQVRFSCFGPYLSEQTIRFDHLAENGLFLICGETGSGKTTILDAMCCALYGSCSGDLRGELDAMRCKQADPADPTEVELIFENNGTRYLFGRKLTPRKSRKADAAVTYNEDYRCLRESGGTWIPLLDNCKKKSMNAKAAELIGLDPDQFRQVIILPQGKFETLLTSGSEEKESILSSLFHTERWKTAVERMAKELNERESGMARETQTIREGLERLQVPSVEALPAAVEAAVREAADAAEEERRAAAAKKAAQDRLNLDRDFTELDRRLANRTNARKAAEGDRQLQIRLDMAVRAEKARKPHDDRQQAADRLNSAGRKLVETEAELARAEEKLQKAAAERAAHEALAEDQRKRTGEQQRLSALRGRYQNIAALQDAAGKAEKDLRAAERKEATAKASLRSADEKLQSLLDAWNEAMEDNKNISRAYQAATAGHLAATLKEGLPCPVCGSLHHPVPARLPEGAVRDQDVKNANRRVIDAHEAYTKQVEVRKKADADWQAAHLALTAAQAGYAQAKGALDQELAQRDPGLETLEALEARIRQLAEAAQAYETKQEKLAAAHQQAEVNRNALKTAESDRKDQKESAEKEFAEKEAAWRKALQETGLGTEVQYAAMILSPDDQEKLRRTLSDHAAAIVAAEKALAEQQARLEGKIRPEPGTAEAAWQQAEQKHQEAIQARTLAGRKRDQLAEEAEHLTQLNAKIADKRKALDEDTAFVRALRGSTGISLQRYVLSVRLGQVLTEANRLLSGIYGGRYRLHRSNESYGSSHKSGLELEVSDTMSDQRRSVCTLSGGEKFLVALSLAIGLCTVVQNEQRGVTLEAMFIDEGFGSLDQNSLYDALEILQTVRRGRGLVGIISHIQLLEEIIPAKIITQKTPHGSTLHLT